MDSIDRFVRIPALGDPALIGDEDEQVSRRMPRFQRIHDRGKDLELLETCRVVPGVVVDDAIPVEQDGASSYRMGLGRMRFHASGNGRAGGDRYGHFEQTDVFPADGSKHEAAAHVTAHLLRRHIHEGHHLLALEFIGGVVSHELGGGFQHTHWTEIHLEDIGWPPRSIEQFRGLDRTHTQITCGEISRVDGGFGIHCRRRPLRLEK